jgi:hypothetical protein
VVSFVEIVGAAEIESGAVLGAEREAGATWVAGRRTRLMKNFAAEGKGVSHLILKDPASEPEILVSRAWIDPIPTAAIGAPFAKILLHPDGKERMCAARAKAAVSVPSREI